MKYLLLISFFSITLTSCSSFKKSQRNISSMSDIESGYKIKCESDIQTLLIGVTRSGAADIFFFTKDGDQEIKNAIRYITDHPVSIDSHEFPMLFKGKNRDKKYLRYITKIEESNSYLSAEVKILGGIERLQKTTFSTCNFL